MAQQQPQQLTPRITKGPIESAPCPHCGHVGDYRQIKEMGLMERGNTTTCDKCGRAAMIVGVVTTTIIALRQTNGRRAADGSVQAQTTTQAMQRRPPANVQRRR